MVNPLKTNKCVMVSDEHFLSFPFFYALDIQSNMKLGRYIISPAGDTQCSRIIRINQVSSTLIRLASQN